MRPPIQDSVDRLYDRAPRSGTVPAPTTHPGVAGQLDPGSTRAPRVVSGAPPETSHSSHPSHDDFQPLILPTAVDRDADGNQVFGPKTAAALANLLHVVAQRRLADQTRAVLDDALTFIRDGNILLPRIQRALDEIPTDQRGGLRNAVSQLGRELLDLSDRLSLSQPRDAATACSPEQTNPATSAK